MGLMVPFVVTKNSVVRLEESLVILLLKAAEVNVPMTISLYEGQCITHLLAYGDVDPQSAAMVLKEVLTLAGIPLIKVAITEIREDDEDGEGQFASSLFLKKGDEEVSFPIFPGDAILLALATGAPMFIDEAVVMRATEGEYAQRFLAFVEETVPIALET
jgi:bifunctional DNase/RNase